MKIKNIILVLRTGIILSSSIMIYVFCTCHLGHFLIIALLVLQHLITNGALLFYILEFNTNLNDSLKFTKYLFPEKFLNFDIY